MNETAYAMQIIRQLVCIIGERPAGSQNEKLAFDFLESELKDLNYQVTRQNFLFSAPGRYFLLYILGGLVLIFAGLKFSSFPWFSIVVPFLIFILPQIARVNFHFGKKSCQSLNLFAELNLEKQLVDSKKMNIQNTGYEQPVLNKKKCLVMCAHVDSARANAFKNKSLLRAYGRTLFIAQRVAIAISCLALLSFLGFAIPLFLERLITGFSILVGSWWILMELLSQARTIYSRGAYDNAAAVGVLMALARYFSQASLENIGLVFLFTGAEEVGMEGASHYANFIHQQEKYQYSVLNLDLVGSGDELQYVSLDGTVFPRKTDASMNELIKKLHPKIKKVWYTKQSGDYLPFIKMGIAATSIQTAGNTLANFSYHTIYDSIELIRERSVEKVINFSRMFIQEYENISD